MNCDIPFDKSILGIDSRSLSRNQCCTLDNDNKACWNSSSHPIEVYDIKKNKIYNRGLFKDDFSREEWHHKYIDGKHGELDKNDQGQRMPNYTCTTQQIQSSDCESMCNNMDSCTMYILEGNECKLRVCDYL